MEKTHQLPTSIMIKERSSRWPGHAARHSDNSMVKQVMHLCYDGCEGYGESRCFNFLVQNQASLGAAGAAEKGRSARSARNRFF